MIKDVMVFCPVYRLEPETVQAIFALEWDGAITYHFQKDNPLTLPTKRETGIRNHLHQYQRGRDMFLRGDYDAMLVIESDIIPPPDTLTRLAAIDADTAYGAYVFRQSPVVNIMERYSEGALNVGESLTVRHKWEWAKAQGVIDCSGAGLGCVLIKRHVLEAIDFRASTLPTARVHCDSWFTCDVYEAGYSMKADCNVLCGHKDEDGTIIWPQ
jgi:hypothetical protein